MRQDDTAAETPVTTFGGRHLPIHAAPPNGVDIYNDYFTVEYSSEEDADDAFADWVVWYITTWEPEWISPLAGVEVSASKHEELLALIDSKLKTAQHTFYTDNSDNSGRGRNPIPWHLRPTISAWTAPEGARESTEYSDARMLTRDQSLRRLRAVDEAPARDL